MFPITKRLGALLLLLAAAGCDVEPYPFGEYRQGDARVTVQITPRPGGGRWITSGGSQVYACYYDAVATVTGSEPRNWVFLWDIYGNGKFGNYTMRPHAFGGTTLSGDIGPGNIWTQLFNPPAPPPLGAGQYALAVEETKSLPNFWLGHTQGPFDYTATMYYGEGGMNYYSSGQTTLRIDLTCS